MSSEALASRPARRERIAPGDWWKISGHTAVAAAAAAVLAAAYGPPLLAAFLALPVIGWSRLALRAHTTAQVTAGTLLGVLAGCAIFVPLR